MCNFSRSFGEDTSHRCVTWITDAWVNKRDVQASIWDLRKVELIFDRAVFQTWRCSMRSISRRQFVAASVVGGNPFPSKCLVQFQSLLSMTGWPRAALSATANNSNRGKDSVVLEGDRNG
jgi:hypothetical protein